MKTLFIEPGSPWENGYIESFNARLRDGLLNGEIFTTLLEAKVLIENWRREYNTIRPHSSLGYKPPAPEAVMPSYERKSNSESGTMSGGRPRYRFDMEKGISETTECPKNPYKEVP